MAVVWLALSTELVAQPVNDNFANRIHLSGTRVTTSGTSVGATRELGEPDLATGNSPRRLHTVWWSWTAPADGVLAVSGIGSDFTAWVDVLAGATLEQLRLASICLAFGPPGCEVAHASVTAGMTYQIAVAGPDDIAGGILLNLAFSERPANDDFADRIHLGNGNVTVTMTNTAATTEADEYSNFLSYYGRSVWWSWTAPASGSVTMGVEANPFSPEAPLFGEYPGGPTALSIYVGTSPGAVTPVTNQFSRDFVGAPSLSQVRFDAVAGTTYQIAVDGAVGSFSALTLRIARTQPPLALMTGPLNGAEFVAGAPVTATAEALDPDGTVRVVEFFIDDLYGRYGNGDRSYRDATRPFSGTWTNLPPGEYHVSVRATDDLGATSDAFPVRFNVRPVNDAFARRIAFTGAFVSVTGTLANASSEPDEPSGTRSASVWWSWTAPSSGTFTFTVMSDSDFYPTLALFSGASLNTLIEIARPAAEGFGANYSTRVVIHAEAGTVYPIAVSTDSYGGWCKLSVAKTVPPEVTITSPVPEASFIVGEPVTFAATASDVDGSVRRVDFVLDDYQALGSVTNPPFTLVRTFTQGYTRHRVRAWAMDDTGIATPSEPVEFDMNYPGPTNDHFADRSAFTGSFVSVTGSTANATREPGETNVFYGGTTWWAWTAPESAAFTVTVRSEPGYKPSLAVFTGTTLASLELITNSTFADYDDTYETRLVIHAQAGATYPLAVGSGGQVTLSIARTLPPIVSLVNPTNYAEYVVGETIELKAEAFDPDGKIAQVEFYRDGYYLLGGVTNSPYVLNFSTTNFEGYARIQARATDNFGVRTVSDDVRFQVRYPGPLNDNFVDRIFLTGSFVSVTGTTANATIEASENIFWGSGSVWWAWTAPESADFTITATSRSGYWTSLAIYNGTILSDLELIERSSFTEDGLTYSRRVVLHAEAGITYSIAVESYDDIVLSVVKSVPPEVTITSPAQGARLQAGEPTTFTATATDADGTVRRVDFLLNNDRVIGSVTNSPFALVHTLAEGSFGSQLRVRMRALAVDDTGLSTYSDPVEFEIYYSYPPPVNDNFASRIPLTGTFTIVDGSLRSATREPDEPTPESPAEGGSVWWSWTAPASGHVTLTGSRAAWFLGAYTGSNLTSLITVATNAWSGYPVQVTFDAVAGTEYQIACVSLNSGGEPVRLALFLDARELRGPRRLSNGMFAFDLRTTVERLWIIEASTNLVNWSPIAAGRCADGTLEFIDPVMAEIPRRFYRAVASP